MNGEKVTILENHRVLVEAIAGHFKKKLPPSVSFADLVQDGYVGLLEAITAYDRTQGASFETYAGIRIRGAMLDGLRREQNITRGLARFSREMKIAQCAVEQREMQPARYREIAKKMGIKFPRFLKLLSRLYHGGTVYVEDHNDMDFFGIDVSDGGMHTKSGEELCQIAEMMQDAHKILTSLGNPHGLVIRLYLFDELKEYEIGVILGISESRVCQIFHEGIDAARAQLLFRDTALG